jgi:hypothetical protein
VVAASPDRVCVQSLTGRDIAATYQNWDSVRGLVDGPVLLDGALDAAGLAGLWSGAQVTSLPA